MDLIGRNTSPIAESLSSNCGIVSPNRFGRKHTRDGGAHRHYHRVLEPVSRLGPPTPWSRELRPQVQRRLDQQFHGVPKMTCCLLRLADDNFGIWGEKRAPVKRNERTAVLCAQIRAVLSPVGWHSVSVAECECAVMQHVRLRVITHQAMRGWKRWWWRQRTNALGCCVPEKREQCPEGEVVLSRDRPGIPSEAGAASRAPTIGRHYRCQRWNRVSAFPGRPR